MTDVPDPSRRSVLKYGLGGAALLGLGGVGLALRPTLIVAPRAPLQCLNEREFSIMAAVAEVFVPGGDGWPSAWDLRVPETVDAGLAVCHEGVIGEMKQLLALLENALAGAILDRRISTFSACSAKRRRRILLSWRDARTLLFRSGFKALHGFCVASYYNEPAVHRKVGYPGVPPWIHEARLRPPPPRSATRTPDPQPTDEP